MHEHVELCVTSQRLSRTLKIGVSFSILLCVPAKRPIASRAETRGLLGIHSGFEAGRAHALPKILTLLCWPNNEGGPLSFTAQPLQFWSFMMLKLRV